MKDVTLNSQLSTLNSSLATAVRPGVRESPFPETIGQRSVFADKKEEGI